MFMSTKVYGMYSYKGGAGRTVSTANLASILAFELNKKVVCIDMDMEGAGLGVVLGIHDKLSDTNRLCVQDIFGDDRIKSPQDFEENWWPRIHFDIGDELGVFESTGKLLLVPAAFAARTVEWTEQMERTLDKFLRNIANYIQPDIILLDSASGLQDWACLTMECSHGLIVFFRWNKQFVEGTIKVINFLQESDIGIENIYLVPSAVPDIPDESSRYNAILESSMTRLKMETGVDRSTNIQLHQGICEAVGLKWEERLLSVVEDREPDEEVALERFRELASHILK